MATSLMYGSLDLAAAPYRVYVGGVDFGGPEPVTTALPRLLLDGEIVSGSRSSNRAMVFTVEIEADDLTALSEYESALAMEVEKARNTLSWSPDGIAPITVFDTFRAKMVNQYDDGLDLNNIRVFQVTIPALPFARSNDVVSTTSVYDGPGAVVDGCDSTTGWTANVQSALESNPHLTFSVDTTTYATATGSLTVTRDVDATTSGGAMSSTLLNYWKADVRYTRPASFDMAGSEYLSVQMKGSLTLQVPSLGYTKAGHVSWPSAPDRSETLPSGWNLYTWFVGDGVISDLVIEATQLAYAPRGYPGPTTATFWLDDLEKSSASGSTAKQATSTLALEGSVRTPGSLQIAGSTSLGHTLVYTAPDLGDGFRPDLVRWRTAGTLTTDATAINGASSTFIGTAFDVPASTLRPGAYAVVARVSGGTGSSGSTLSLSVSAALQFSGSSVGATQTASSQVTLTSDGWQIAPLGVLHLPPTLVPEGSNALVHVSCSGSGASLDEMWLFPMDGALTIVDCGTGTPSASGSSSYLWLDQPTVDQPRGGLWRGTLPDKSDARMASTSVQAFGAHLFSPPQTLLFLVTANVQGAEATLNYYPRWHTTAAL